MNSRTIVGHVGWNSSFDLPVVEVEAADYAFGSNPPYGRGLADRLIRFALEDARARGLAVLPFCPFVKSFIERHREFEALVPDAYREQFGL